MKTRNNTIFVTGGGSGIGRALAESFHRLGNQVIIAGRGTKQLDETRAENPGMLSYQLDQADASAIKSLAAKLAQEHRSLNVLINCAGIQRTENLIEASPADMEATIEINLLGPMRLTAALLPTLMAQPYAAIVNVSSALAFVPQAATPTYCATKAAIHSYTQSLRYQLRKTSVEVIEVIPPWVQTGLQGSRAHDPRAMPLADFISETMNLMERNPSSPEVIVDHAKPMRFAESTGKFEKIYGALNERTPMAAPA